MSIFIPSKLTVELQAPATAFRPVEGRKYTFIHSDVSGGLFLAIGKNFDYKNINQKDRDEVFAEWKRQMGEFVLWGQVHVSGGEFDEKYAKVRYLIFKKELDLALKAMIYGDQSLFTSFPWLLDAPIYIQFESEFSQYNQILYYGRPRDYLYMTTQQTVS
ncbi:staygreen family protein [Neobacillus sp. SM06]|uniref:staygreen family protein n=1 Tax=Neobacillus sp. SM06 TaxID=3422492 RepID=UPI003D2C1231